MSELPAPLAGLRTEVEAELRDRLPPHLERLGGLHQRLGEVADELEAVVFSGGKRLRPVLLLAGHRCAGGDHRAVMGPALALELLHTCALLHDDVIDEAARRRGRTTTHEGFASRHRDRGWAGSPQAFGRAVAILVGDLAFVLADELFCEAEVAPGRLLDGLARFTTLREELMAGQYLDLAAAHAGSSSRELARLIATTKSGRYSISRPLQIGAALAGAGQALLEGLASFGEPLGRAFQVRDDLLDVLGDETTTGKSGGLDLREGKRTLLVVEALHRLQRGGRDEFERLLARPEPSGEDLARLRELLHSSGAVEATRTQLQAWTEQAGSAARRLPVGDRWRGALTELAGYVAARQA